MRVLRRNGDDLKWSAKLMSDWGRDDHHHKAAMLALSKDIFELAGVRNYYLDRETLLKMYDQYMSYAPTVTPQWKQNQDALYDKLIEIAAAPEASYGFPHGAVSASKVGGNDLTAGETAPIDPNKWAFDHGLEST
jgi:hypothetical protein